MGIFLFFTFFVTDLIVILACGYEYKKYNQYREGMILGVHIPAEAVETEAVQAICQKERRQRTVFQRVNHVLNLAVSLLCIYQMELGVLFWIFWIVEYLVGLDIITTRPHKELYNLKVKKQWVIEGAKHLVHIDTRAAALSGKTAYSWKWHLLLTLTVGAAGIPLLNRGSWFMRESVGMVLYGMSVGVSLLFLVMHIWIVGNRTVVYSQNPDVNLAVNQLVKRNWSLAFLAGSAGNGLAWIYLVWKIWQEDWLANKHLVIYTAIQLLGSAAFLYFVCGIQGKKREILEADADGIYVDDDEYWKNGYYSNPNDRRIMVQGRVSSTNYTFNMGRPAGRIIYGGILLFTAGALGWAAMVMISMLTMKVSFHVKTESAIIHLTDFAEKSNDMVDSAEETESSIRSGVDSPEDILENSEDYNFRLSAADYECEFSASEILSAELLEELPDDRFSKINGGATDRYNVGHFKGKETGKTMMFLWEGYSPILKITLPELTVFANSKEAGEVTEWYEQLKRMME